MDLARAYMVVLHHLESSSPAKTLENPYFFIESSGDNEPSWYEIAEFIATSLNKAGAKVSGPFTPPVVGMNARSRAVRLRELGWQPREKDWKSSYVEDELPELLKEKRS